MEGTFLEIAQKLSAALTTSTRKDEEKYVHFKDGSPDWMREFAHEVHNSVSESLPDDDIYRFMEKALDAIVDNDAEDDDAAQEAVDEIEGDIYTHDLTKWFSRNYEYCDQAIKEGLWSLDSDGGVINLIQCGQMLHIREVGGAVISQLKDLVENQEAA